MNFFKNKPKHTPGPWVIHSLALEEYSQVVSAKGCMVQICHTKEVWGDRKTYEDFSETKGNALLIAAAPDLLDLLERVAEYADDKTPIHASDNLIADIRAGIAKATGAAA